MDRRKIAMLCLALLLVLLLACGPKEPSPSPDKVECYRLIVICGDIVMSNNQCVREHHSVFPIVPFEKEIRFTYCYGDAGRWRFFEKDCQATRGDRCD